MSRFQDLHYAPVVQSAFHRLATTAFVCCRTWIQVASAFAKRMPKVLAASMLLLILFGCKSSSSTHHNTSMNCDTTLHQFDQHDFSNWTGLSSDCTPEVIVQFAGGSPGSYGQTFMGSKRLATTFLMLNFKGYDEPVQLNTREGKVVCLLVNFPDLENAPAIAKTLGEPAAKLDFYYDIMLNRSGEWVYPAQGITLFMNSDRSNAVKLMVYPPMTLERYQAEVYVLEPPREERAPED
jgi:hypothetical protein